MMTVSTRSRMRSHNRLACLMVVVMTSWQPMVQGFTPLPSLSSSSSLLSTFASPPPSNRATRTSLWQHLGGDSLTSTTAKTTNNKKTKKKKQRNGQKKKQRSSSSTSRIRADRLVQGMSTPNPTLESKHDLADHVQQMYIYGPGGVLTDKMRRRDRQSTAAQQQQQQYLRKLDSHPSLVLNKDYQPLSFLPLSMWHWQDVIKAVCSGKADVVEVYPDVTIAAPQNLAIPLPSVIALRQYVPQQYAKRPAFTKRNVFLRDEYRCQYCGGHFYTRDLSLDHVVPRSRGGLLHWDNAVTCCLACNGRKGSLDVSDLRRVGMKLRQRPYVPTQFQLAQTAARLLPRKVHPTWKPFLGAQYNQQQQQNDDDDAADYDDTDHHDDIW